MSRNPSRAGFRRHPRIADQMTADLYACVDRSQAAERAGDAAEALEWHQAVPMFRRGRHRALLERLAALAGDADGELPEWVWARWIAYQVTRCEDGDVGAEMRRCGRALAETVHSDLMEECFEAGGDPIQVLSTMLGESWFCHQMLVYEVGAMSAFIDEFATGRLAEHSGLARSWANARLSGYQIGESLPGALLRVREGGTHEWVDVLDIGARTCATRNEWVLGRLVPSGLGDLMMFDMPPLEVAQDLAQQVAGAPASDWWEVVTTDHLAQGSSSRQFLREDYELATDVQELELIRYGTKAEDLARVMQQVREGRDETSRAAYRILRCARDGQVDSSDQAYVGAAIQLPRPYDDARASLVRPGDADVWSSWAAAVRSPSRERLMAMADAAHAAA